MKKKYIVIYFTKEGILKISRIEWCKVVQSGAISHKLSGSGELYVLGRIPTFTRF